MNYRELNEYKKSFESVSSTTERLEICKELMSKTIDKWLEYDETV